MTYDPYTASRMNVAHFLLNLDFYGRKRGADVRLAGACRRGCRLVACIVDKERRLAAVTGVLAVAAFLLPYAFERMREHRYLICPLYPWLGGLLRVRGAGDREPPSKGRGCPAPRDRRARRRAAARDVAPPCIRHGVARPGLRRARRAPSSATRSSSADDLSGPVRLYTGLNRVPLHLDEVRGAGSDVRDHRSPWAARVLPPGTATPRKEHFGSCGRTACLLRPRSLRRRRRRNPLWRYLGAP